MTYTTVPTVVAGQKVAASTYGNEVAAAIAELQAALPEARTTWSSPITSGLTAGNGTTTASYVRIGPLVFASFKFVFGSTSAVTASIVLDLPVDAAVAATLGSSAYAFDDSASSTYPLLPSTTLSTSVTIRNHASPAAALSATVPFTWATSDILTVNLVYLAA